MNRSIVYERSFGFAVKIIETYKYLHEEKRELVLSKQLLRSGTSIGANVREGLIGQSKKDFVAKMYIALKEASETEYWLELLITTNYLEKEKASSLLNEVGEIGKMLNSIILTSKNGPKRT